MKIQRTAQSADAILAWANLAWLGVVLFIVPFLHIHGWPDSVVGLSVVTCILILGLQREKQIGQAKTEARHGKADG